MNAPDSQATSGIIAFSTAHYDAMTAFFRAIGFDIREDPNDQLVPLFESGRGAFVSRGDVSFNLEESMSSEAFARFNLLLTGYPESELQRIAAVGYEHKAEDSLHGTHHTFISPDGGSVTISQ